jgi:arylsulfatase A-like enzyme
MKSYRIFRGLVLIYLTCLMFSCQHEEHKPYNVLFIAVDDLNDYVSLLQDYPGIKTPNLDDLANSTVTFTQAYCAGPICNPSRTALLTGLAPHVTGVYNNNDHWRSSKAAEEAMVLPEAFKSAGYTTFWAGKIFHDLSAPSKARLEAMWDDLGNNIPGELWDGSTNIIPYGPGLPKGYGVLPDSVFADISNARLAKEWLNKDYDKPFFMAIGIIRPHRPWTAPQRFFDMYPLDSLTMPPPGYLENDLDDVPEIGRKLALNGGINVDKLKKLGRWEETVQAYLASVSFADESIGKVIDALNQSKYKDNTIIVLWGDHGYHMGEKDHMAKSTLWEQGTHNILMFHVPDVENGGTVCPEPVSLLDIYPTLKELCGLPEVPQALSGVSITNLIRHPDQKRGAPVLTTFPYNSHGLRDANWRYIQYEDGGEELYDHASDPHEWTNLAGDTAYAEKMNEMRKWLPETNAEPVGPLPALAIWQEEKRKSQDNFNNITFGNPTKKD